MRNYMHRNVPYGAVITRRPMDGKKVWIFFNRDYNPIGRTNYTATKRGHKRGYVAYDPDVDGITVAPVMVAKLRALAVTVCGANKIWFYTDRNRDNIPELVRLLTMI